MKFEVGKWYAPQMSATQEVCGAFVPVKVLRRTPKQIVLGYKSERYLNQRRKFEVVDGVENTSVFGVCYAADRLTGEGSINT